MNDLDTKIRKALQAATELHGSVPEPSFIEEVMEAFRGRHSFLNISGAIKMISAGLIFYFCVYQFFHQTTTMAMLAYASAALICMVVASTTMLWIWVQMNHNSTSREVKKLELQIALLTQELQQQNQSSHVEE